MKHLAIQAFALSLLLGLMTTATSIGDAMRHPWSLACARIGFAFVLFGFVGAVGMELHRRRTALETQPDERVAALVSEMVYRFARHLDQSLPAWEELPKRERAAVHAFLHDDCADLINKLNEIAREDDSTDDDDDDGGLPDAAP